MTSSPSKRDRARVRPHDPEDRLQRRRLPGRVASEQRDELARPDLDLDVLEDVDQAVVGVDPGETEQRLAARGLLAHFRSAALVPRYASITRGSVATASNDPSAILTPWSSAITRSEMPFDDVHVVLDHEDRVAALGAELRDQLGDLVRLDRVHPGGGLVEQEQPRVGRGRARDLEPAPVRVREAVRGLIPAVAHQPLAEEREPPLGELADLALLAPLAGRAQHRAERLPPWCARTPPPSRSRARSCSGRGAASGRCARSRAG